MNELKIFQNPEFGTVRTIEIEGKIHFAGIDVAKALGYSIPSKAIQTHCRNILKWKVGVKTGVKSDGTDSIQRMEMLFIPESDLYRLIMRSQLPNAEKFSDWVCEEVLPSIRQTGSYSIEKKPDSYMIENPAERARRWAEEYEEKRALEVKVTELEPKGQYFDSLVDSRLLTTFRDTAKELHIPPKQFTQWLVEKGYVYRDRHNMIKQYEQYRKNGLFKMKDFLTPAGFSNVQTYITVKGKETFRLLLSMEN